MRRGILKGFVWGSVVSVGLVTVANELVDHVSVQSLSEPDPENVSANLVGEPASIAEDLEGEAASQDVFSTDNTSTQSVGVVDDVVAPNEASASVDAAPVGAAPETDVVIAQIADAPDASILTPGTDIAEEVPVVDLGALASLDAPDAENALLTLLDTQPPELPLSLLQEPDTSNLPSEDLAADNADSAEREIASVDVFNTTDNEAPSQADDTAADTLTDTLKAERDTAERDTALQSTEAQSAEILSAETQNTGAQNTDAQNAQTQSVVSFGESYDAIRGSVRLSLLSAAEGEIPVVKAEDLPALIAHSSSYEKQTDVPNVSIVLVDIGALNLSTSTLIDIPFPVTFAVDALAEGAAERAMLYKTAGFEVLSLISVAETATPQDVRVTFDQAGKLVPTSVGFLDVPSASFQADVTTATQVVEAAQATGHGIISFASETGAMMQEAMRANVPAALVFRDFDGGGASSEAMMRGLDQAAFRAGVDEDIVMLGRAQAETLAVLSDWASGERAATIEMVPISLMLQEQLAP